MVKGTHMNTNSARKCIFAVITTVFISEHLHAQTPRSWSAGYRVELLNANGEPANDMMGSGAFVRYRANDAYQLEAAFEYFEYDFESPEQYLGISGSISDDADSRTRLTLVSLRVERALGKREQSIRPFGFLGLGIGYAAIDDFTTTANGQTYNINAEGGIETVPACGIGILYERPKWAVDGGIKVERHLSNWRLDEQYSGRTVELNDYTAWGLWLGLSVQI